MPDDTDINSIFKTELPSPNAVTSDDDGDFIVENWNEHTVKLMEDDVMNQHLAVEAF